MLGVNSVKLLLISVQSQHATGGIAVWTEHFLSRCQQNDIFCHLVNLQVSQRRYLTGKRKLIDEWHRTITIFRKLKKQLSEQTYDAVYLNTSCGPYGLFRDKSIASVIQKRQIPLVTHYHCEIPFWVKSKTSRRCLGLLAHMSNRNLVLCQSSLEFMKNYYHVDAVKVPNFVETSFVRSEDKEISPTIRQIFFVGRVAESKGAKELFDVAERLPNIIFKFAGNVSSVVAHWSKPPNVHLLGNIPRSDVLKLLDESDLFLFPSHTEGSSIALIECMARGVPAIAANVGSNADMLQNGCGIIVEKEDVSAMMDAISKLQDTELRRTMSQNAIRRVKEHYTDKNVDSIIDILRQVV